MTRIQIRICKQSIIQEATFTRTTFVLRRMELALDLLLVKMISNKGNDSNHSNLSIYTYVCMYIYIYIDIVIELLSAPGCQICCYLQHLLLIIIQYYYYSIILPVILIIPIEPLYCYNNNNYYYSTSGLAPNRCCLQLRFRNLPAEGPRPCIRLMINVISFIAIIIIIIISVQYFKLSRYIILQYGCLVY